MYYFPTLHNELCAGFFKSKANTAYDLLHNVVLQITTIMPRYTMT